MRVTTPVVEAPLVMMEHVQHASVIDFVPPAPFATNTATAPMVESFTSAPAVTCTARAPVDECTHDSFMAGLVAQCKVRCLPPLPRLT